MKRDVLWDAEDHVSASAVAETALRIVRPPAVLIVIRGMILAHTVPVALTAAPVTVNQDMKALSPRRGLDARFLTYQLRSRSSALLALVEEAGHGTRCLRTDLWRKLPIAVPPLAEQTLIADFLDRKTASIDSLIEKKERLLALVDERRLAALCAHVTKGVSSGTSLRHSGHPWLGALPAHWPVLRVRDVAKLESGHTPDKGNPDHWRDDNDIPWVSLNDTKVLAAKDYIDDTTLHINALGLQNSSARMLPARVVVFTRDATIGKAAITTKPMAVSQHIIAWVCGPRILPEYLLRVFYVMEKELVRYTMGATLRTIGMDDVNTLVTPVPPLDEQREIVRRAEASAANHDALAESLRQQIGALHEYRRALVTAAVTGQLNVAAEEAA